MGTPDPGRSASTATPRDVFRCMTPLVANRRKEEPELHADLAALELARNDQEQVLRVVLAGLARRV